MERKYILLAEDNAELRETMAAVLRAGGFAVLTATDGRAALLQLSDTKDTFDLLITDFDMPHMTGGSLIATLRKMPQFARMPMIVNSGLLRTVPGADVVLRKPVPPEVLLTTATRLCMEDRSQAVNLESDQLVVSDAVDDKGQRSV